MTMGPYGVHWERTQTWWDLVPAYHAYLARCQFLLRQGRPVADVCYLAAEGAPQVFRPPASATRGHPPDRLGYNFDGIAPETLLARMSVRNGMLVLPDGMSYRVLVLPERDTMTPALLRMVKTLVEAGATVVGPRPLKSPSLSGYPNCDEDVKQLAGELWGDCDGVAVKEHRLGKGRMVWDRGTKAAGTPETKSPLESATWIWHNEGNPAASAPVGKRHFRRVVAMETNAGIESARVFMTADNSFALFVNGRPAGNGDNFHETYSFDVAPMLHPGTNVLAVEAENGGDAPNPAGLIGRLIVSFRDGHRLEVPTDRTWQSSREAAPDWLTRASNAEGWDAALELGRFGMSPWGRPEETTPEPDQYGDFAIVAGLLEKAGVMVDFESDGPIRYTHRRAGDTDIYFIANREERVVNANGSFRVMGKTPELWDPLTGERRALPEFTAKAGRTTVPLRFEPAQSFFIVFNKGAMTSRKNSRNLVALKPVAELDGPWEVAFDPKWGGPEKVTFASLEDWTRRPEDGIRFYSGMATYRKTFDAPAGPVGRRRYLDLGVVKNLARVRLNGRDLGILWCAPWRVEITKTLKPTGNRLEITVANLWPNRLIGDQALPPERRLTSTTWNPFTKDSPLLESGLLGPVTLEEETGER
jgi:hypothetical protein